MRNPYDVLGVAPQATEMEIRKAFRRLAKRTHPDADRGNPQAEARFKEINAAYSLVSDPAQRARFDRGEIDAEGNERPAAGTGSRARRPGRSEFNFRFGGVGGDAAADLFGHMFGESAAAPETRHTVTVDFLSAVNGGRRRVALPGGRMLDVVLPAGCCDGQVLRLAGDLLLEVKVTPHELFRRAGDDIFVEVPITLVEAVAGGRITVPTPSGRVVVAVPPGSNTGTVLRLRGKGVHGGDQYVTLKVVLPERVDEELASFVRAWGRRHHYDPRAGL